MAHQKYHPNQPAAAAKFFPEQYQALQHEIQWAELQPRGFIWSAYIWNMFDFNVAGWNRGGTKGLNHKGLISYDRKQKKDAFYFYKANWSDQPVLHISSKRLKEVGEPSIEIKAYSNCEKVTLTVNGKTISTSMGDDVNIFKWSDIKLNEGENVIEVLGTGGQSKSDLKDRWEVVCDPEVKRRDMMLMDGVMWVVMIS